ncbi:unnamed protein product [Pieris macdunnoughi]|uniref:Tc1-like transposase DDE domain-containing protein n=1 Tax=Pieris macdunnoughi TaxID=345717 RepID=A0A821X9Y7_9NEOP|nr:unnamed protein product [Pieris macdunnoughi]
MGRTIHSAERNLVLKVIQFFENEKKHGSFTVPVEQATKRACAATGLSKTTIMTIKREAKKIQTETARAANVQEDMTSFEDGEHPQPSTSASVATDTIKLSTPGSTQALSYTTRKEIPTLKKILTIAKRELNFPGQKDALRNILINDLGYSFKKFKRKRDFLVQRPEIAAWRAKYLRRLKENDERGAEKKPVTFIDETWIHSHYTLSKCWQNSSDSSVRINHSPGQRWIVVHAGNENGFIQGAELLYKCKSTTGDYHDEMDASNFTKWIKEKLIPNLPPNGIIVMDNAPYHSKQANKPPNFSARKNEMQTWLQEHNIKFDDKMTKRELYMLIQRNKPEKVYFIDEIFRAHGHEVLRLPPYHCDLNPIEYVWNLMKQRVADKNIDQSEKDIERLTKAAIQSITPEDWKKNATMLIA